MPVRLPGSVGGHKREGRLLSNTVLLVLLTVIPLVAGCAVAGDDFDRKLKPIIQPHGFDLLDWELRTLANELKLIFVPDKQVVGDEVKLVREYFSLAGQMQTLKFHIDQARSEGSADLNLLQSQLAILQVRRDALENTVEGILERQIRAVLIEERILNPLDSYLQLGIVFPPVNFEFEQPPHLLVISPRDRIEFSKRVLLSQNLSPDARERIESETDELGVSSLVVDLGGFAAMY
ncbi:MAG: hypothetical protein V3S51_07475, partial [Dehalococcoidia bacterium]